MNDNLSKNVKTRNARRGGRPSQKDAAKIEGQILDVAQELFFTQGYGSTSIEMIAQKAHISKRTFYHRFKDKGDIFRAVIHRVIEKIKPMDTWDSLATGPFEDCLLKLSEAILHAALLPEVLSLQRIIIGEAARFPELARAANQQGSRQEAIHKIADLLQREVNNKHIRIDKPMFAAEQFLHMLVSSPQRHAMGMGQRLGQHERALWARDTVDLFLNGCRVNK